MSTSFSEYLQFSLIRISLLVGLFVLAKIEANAQVTRTFVPTSGSWSVPSNWNPSGIPGVTDILIFPSSTTSVTNIPESASVASILIEGNSGEIRFSNSNQGINGENFISISNSLNILSGKTLLLGIGNGQRRLSLLVPVNAIAKVEGTINLDGRTSSNQQGVIVQGTMDLGPNGKITNDSGFSAYFDLKSGGTLKIGSSQGINTSGATGNIQTSTRIISSGGNYEYSGTTNQATGDALPSTLNSLTINNSGTAGNNQVTLSANKIISSAITITSGVLDMGTFTLTNSGSSSNFSIGSNGILKVGGTNNFPSGFQTVSIQCSGTVNYYANGNQTIAAVNYGNLTLGGSGIKTLQTATQQICTNFSLSGSVQTSAVANLSIGGSVMISSGSIFSAGTFTHSIGGNWSNSGTFNPQTSTIQFAGANPASINGGSFYHLVFQNTGLKSITNSIAASESTSIQGPIQLATGVTFQSFPDKQFVISSSGAVSTQGTSKIQIQSESIYRNLSTSNPFLEVQRELIGVKGWRMLGSPTTTTYSLALENVVTQGFPGSSFPDLQPNLLWWDETDQGTSLQAWRQPAQLSEALPAGKGHYLYVFNGDTKPGGGNYSDLLPLTLSAQGTEVNLASSSFDFGITYSNRDTSLVAQADSLIEVNLSDAGFNLIANPTASSIDFHAASGWTKTNLDQTLYIWDPTSSSFLTWNGTTGSLGSGKIAPFQAFWVRANAANPSLVLTGNGAKTSTQADFFGRKSNETPSDLRLHLTGEGMEADTYLSFSPTGKTGADPLDAYQLESLAENWLLLYTYGSIQTKSPLVINHLPELTSGEQIIPLHLAAAKNGSPFTGAYLLDWAIPENWPEEIEILLMDHLQKKVIDMKKESMHAFQFEGPQTPNARKRKDLIELEHPQAVVFNSPYETGEINLRTQASSNTQRPFTLYIGAYPSENFEYLPDLPKLFTPAPNPFKTEAKLKFYLPAKDLALLTIYDLNGRLVGEFDSQLYEAGIHELDWIPLGIHLPDGIYVVKLSTSSHHFTQKLIKRS